MSSVPRSAPAAICFPPVTLESSTFDFVQSTPGGRRVIYAFEGHFIEACDCFELCPCWVDDRPDEGHCTGLTAWQIESGDINGTLVGGLTVVAVTSHGPVRRDDRATTVLFIDEDADDGQAKALEQAFRGELVDGGTDPLGLLMTVTGRVLDTQKQPIHISTTPHGWSIRVGDRDTGMVSGHGSELVFEGETEALTLHHTALHRELQIQGPSTAQRSAELHVAVPALRGGGYISVDARSGMRGRFEYRH
jgi:hypothetical protein